MTLTSFFRRLQGERPGMRAGPVAFRSGPLPSLLAPTIAIANQVRLADVSYYQDLINFVVMRAAGIAGAIIRAGQRNWIDSKFLENWTKAKEALLPRGSYWLYDSREDPKRQAALWWSLLEGDPGELVSVADLEENYGGPYGRPEHFKAFLLEFQRLSGLPDSRIAIYTGFFWWSKRVGNDPFFKRFPLWLAWYAAMIYVYAPLPWDASDLLLWQYTSSGPGAAYGVSSREIDLNWYCCDLRNFEERFRVGATAPDGETDMSKYYKWIGTAANIRASASTGSADRGNLLTGDVIQVDAPKSGSWFPYRVAQHSDGTWVKLDDGTPLDRNNQVTYWSTDSYFVEVASLPNPPAPAPDPVPVPTLPDLPVTIVLGDDETYLKQTVNVVLKPKL